MSLTTVFDLDGTLVDSQNAVRCAYRLAGVEPPDDFWGRSADKWLPQLCDNSSDIIKLVHHAKQQYYRTLIRSGLVSPLSAAQAFHRVQSAGIRTCVLTAASQRSAVDVLEYHNLLPDALYADSTGDDRVTSLLMELDRLETSTIILIDDRPSSWPHESICVPDTISVIKYEPKMTADALMSRIFELHARNGMTKEIKTWTQ